MAAMPENQSIDAVLNARAPNAGVPWKIFLFSLIVFGAVSAGYAGLVFGYRPYIAAQLNSVNGRIDALAAAVPAQDQQALFQFYSQIVNLKALLQNHVIVSKVPAFWEARTNARVSYTSARLDVPHRELQLEGIADSYTTLTEQLQALSQSPEVERYLLVDSRIPDGKIHFRINATFVPALFK